MIVCDRDSLIMWCEGLLLENKNGRVRICKENDASKAEEALLRGETVLLTEGGEIVSRCVPRDGKWYEETLEEAR